MLKSRAYASVAPVRTQSSTPEDAMKQALLSVVQVWLDRLQSMAVVTTFFVSIDSLLFSLTSTTRPSDLHEWTKRDQVINASLGGAIIFHACASMVAYIGSFVLIRYRLNSAEQAEESLFAQTMVMPAAAPPAATRTGGGTTDQTRRTQSSHRPSASIGSTAAPTSPMDTLRELPLEMFTDLRSLVAVERTRPLVFLGNLCRGRPGNSDTESRTPRGKSDPVASAHDSAVATLESAVGVLARAHTVCAGMALLGFVLALLGILTYSWTAVPSSLGIFASACMGACGIAATLAFW
ncbi:hypothetical protein C2E23DRAFT_723217 [Lenzites betulinus]|nr:hypothetical protein C2E23DRAFT_723217 [Lenzites betulinus]